jgi:hypothetical protein
MAIALAAWSTARDYFGAYAAEPRVYEAFNGAAVERGQLVAGLAAAGPLYVSPALWQQSVIRFQNTLNPPVAMDPRAGLVLPPAGDVTYAFDPVEAEDARAFGERWPELAATALPDRSGAPSLLAFRLARADWPAPAQSLDAAFGHKIRLAAAELPDRARAGEALDLGLEWEALAPTAVDLNLFVHLVDAAGRSVAQLDAAPLDGSYGTDRWRPGERILWPIALQVPAHQPPGPLALRLGWYDYRTGERLPLAGDEDGALELGPIEVAP